MAFLSLALVAVAIACASAQTTTTCEPSGLDIIFVNDGSGSVSPNYHLTQEFINNIINSTDVDYGTTQIGMYQFSSSVKTEFHLNSHGSKAAIMDAVSASVQMGGTTNIIDAMKLAIEEGFGMAAYGNNPDAPDVLIVLTDGVDNSRDPEDPKPFLEEQAKAAADAGITVFVIGVGSGVDQAQLEAAAGDPARVISASDFSALDGIQQSICETIVHDVPTQAPPTLPPPLATSDAPKQCSPSGLDLVVLNDGSGSVAPSDYQKSLDFIKVSPRLAVPTQAPPTLPPPLATSDAPKQCSPSGLDLVVLNDGSGSVAPSDYQKSLDFIKVSPRLAVPTQAPPTLPPPLATSDAPKQCSPSGLDLVVLNDGSGSVAPSDYQKSLDFIKVSPRLAVPTQAPPTLPPPLATSDAPKQCSPSGLDLVVLNDGSGSVAPSDYQKSLDFIKVSPRLAVPTQAPPTLPPPLATSDAPKQCSPSGLDLVVLNDGSGSVAPDDYQKSLDFIKVSPRLAVPTQAPPTLPPPLATSDAPKQCSPSGLDLVVLNDGSGSVAPDDYQKSLDFIKVSPRLAVPTQAPPTLPPPLATSDAPKQCSPSGLDLVVLNDGSGSVAPDDYQKSLDFIKDLIVTAEIEQGVSQIGLIQFSDTPKPEFHLAEHADTPSAIAAADASVQIQATTDIVAAMEAGLNEFLSPANDPIRKDVLLILTDGQDNLAFSPEGTPAAIAALQEKSDALAAAGVTVFVLGVGTGISQEQLEAAAGSPERVFLTGDAGFDALKGMEEHICEEVAKIEDLEDVFGDGQCPIPGDFFVNGGDLEQCKSICEMEAMIWGSEPSQCVDGAETCAHASSPQCMSPDAYLGDKTQTRTGVPCKEWSESGMDVMFPDTHLEGNKCRNPDSDTGPWCYAIDGPSGEAGGWDYCFEACMDGDAGPVASPIPPAP